MEIRDQIILVTGGARGLGLAITHALIREGARVVVNYFNSEESAQQTCQGTCRTGFYLQSRCN